MAFSFNQSTKVKDAFKKHHVRYLFIGKSGAIILGYSDTTQDVDVYIDKSSSNCKNVLKSVLELGFEMDEKQKAEILRGKDFIQLKNGPFDIDLIFAPDGIENFEYAWKRKIDKNGYPVCNIDDIIASKKAANRAKDRESLSRLIKFQEWFNSKQNRS